MLTSPDEVNMVSVSDKGHVEEGGAEETVSESSEVPSVADVEDPHGHNIDLFETSLNLINKYPKLGLSRGLRRVVCRGDVSNNPDITLFSFMLTVPDKERTNARVIEQQRMDKDCAATVALLNSMYIVTGYGGDNAALLHACCAPVESQVDDTSIFTRTNVGACRDALAPDDETPYTFDISDQHHFSKSIQGMLAKTNLSDEDIIGAEDFMQRLLYGITQQLLSHKIIKAGMMHDIENHDQRDLLFEHMVMLPLVDYVASAFFAMGKDIKDNIEWSTITNDDAMRDNIIGVVEHLCATQQSLKQKLDGNDEEYVRASSDLVSKIKERLAEYNSIRDHVSKEVHSVVLNQFHNSIGTQSDDSEEA